MNFFKKMFGANDKVLTETELLDLLGNSICDVGCWSWWTTDLPEVIQLEFVGTQLYFPSKDSQQPPSSQIAIRFNNPKSISFLTRQQYEIPMADNWFDQLQKDEIASFTCDYDNFTFTDNKLMKNIIGQTSKINTIHGYSPTDNNFYNEKVRLVFWAQNAGLAISADSLQLLNKDGKMELKDIKEANKKWWEYWKQYWKLKNTDKPLPKDYACEVTIPAGTDNLFIKRK